jgi:hypothetical protein
MRDGVVRVSGRGGEELCDLALDGGKVGVWVRWCEEERRYSERGGVRR